MFEKVMIVNGVNIAKRYHSRKEMESDFMQDVIDDSLKDIIVEEYEDDTLLRSYKYTPKPALKKNYPFRGFILKIKYLVFEVYYLIKGICRKIKYISQRISRKSHMSDLDTHEFCITISRWLLPKILQYKKFYYEYFYETHHPESLDNLGRYAIAKSEFDEIIYALEWVLYTSPYLYTKKQDDFYIKYYGRTPYHGHKEREYYSMPNDPRDDHELEHEARKRAQKGFELFGYHFTNMGDEA
jgi:hypothetical protein